MPTKKPTKKTKTSPGSRSASTKTAARKTTAKKTTAKSVAPKTSKRPSKKQQDAYVAEIKNLVKKRGAFMKSFVVGETVVEPSVGVCQIAGIKSQQIDGQMEDYYIFNSGSARVYVPHSQIDKRGVRRPMTANEVKKILNQMKSPVTPTRGDARLQYLAYRDIMRSGEPSKICRLLRELYTLDKMDELKGKEKEIMEQAKKFLVDEISFIQEAQKNDIIEMIEDHLDQMYKRKQVKDKEARAKKSSSSS